MSIQNTYAPNLDPQSLIGKLGSPFGIRSIMGVAYDHSYYEYEKVPLFGFISSVMHVSIWACFELHAQSSSDVILLTTQTEQHSNLR